VGVERKGRGGFLILGYQKSFSPLYLSSQLFGHGRSACRKYFNNKKLRRFGEGAERFLVPQYEEAPLQFSTTPSRRKIHSTVSE
jgi:hypothetical protein